MSLATLYYVLLTPLALALAFMLWFLWNVTRQLDGPKAQADKQPIIVVRADDRYTLRSPTLRAGEPRMSSPTVREPNTESVPRGYSPSVSREFSRVPYAPTLGMGLRQASSSADPGARK